MKTVTIHDGHGPESPLFAVYLCALRGPKAEKILVRAVPTETQRHASDVAISKALRATGAPECAFIAVYQDDPTPRVSGMFGAPLGRTGRMLDYDEDAPELIRARVVPIDAGGYDKGGAYWGLRPAGMRLFAVQDGMGNIAFIDAANRADAIASALS